MTPESSAHTIFNNALELADPAQRERYLREASGNDTALQARVRKLLRAYGEAGGFFSQPLQPPTARRTVDAIAVPGIEKGGERICRYKLLEQIGEGGCGMVYLAEQQEPVRRHVALKIIKLGMDTRQVVGRFEAERQVLALMDHPCIAKVLDAGATESGRPYFVMELVSGTKITEFCDRKKLSTRERLELFIRVCHAVQHAHVKGVIHRDLKPSNILVTIVDGAPLPKVIDFGIAKATHNQPLADNTVFTALEQFVGTPAYMSPEQADMSGVDIDTRTDIYSLGVVLYELLTGNTPFDAQAFLRAGIEEIRRTIRDHAPSTPSTRLREMSQADLVTRARARRVDSPKLIQAVKGDLDWIVMKCLEKDRGRRYETANGLAMDIERHLNCEPVVARPPSRWYEFQKTVRRHSIGFAAAALIMISLTVGLAISTWQFTLKNQAYVRADTARRQADQARQDERRLNFQMAFDRGLGLCDQGNVGSGMLWLARALELAPAGETALQRVIRANLTAWQRELHILKGIFPHPQGVVSGAFSPDGTLVLTGGLDGVVQLWDRQTGTVRGPPLLHESEVHSAIFNAEGNIFLTASTDKTARLWETKSGKLIRVFPHNSAVWAGLFTPEGLILTSNSEGQIQVWDPKQDQPVAAWQHPTHSVHDLALSPDGKQVLGACDDGLVLLWDRQTHAVLARFAGHSGRVPTATFVTTNRIASGDIDGNVLLWTWSGAGGTPANGEPIGKQPWRHRGGVHRLRLSEDGERLLTASYDKRAQFLNSETGEPIGVPFEHGGALRDIAFAKDGAILTFCEDDAAREWQPAPGCLEKMLPHDAGAQHALFTPDAKFMLIRGDDGRASVHRSLNREQVGMSFAPGGGVHGFAVSPDESKVMTGGADGKVQFWGAANGRGIGEPFQHRGGAWAVAISRDGRRAVSGGLDGVLLLWDAQASRPLRTLLTLSNAPIRGVAFSLDGSRVAVAGSDKLAWIVPVAGPEEPKMLQGHHGSVMTVAFSDDGKQVATGSFDNTVLVWDVHTGVARTRPMRHGGPFWYAVAFSRDGESVVAGCDDRTARIWDVATSKPIGPALVHNAALRTAAFTEDDAHVITATSLGTTYFWEVFNFPLGGDVDQIVLWLQVSTGMELGADGEVRPLDPDTWLERRKRLTALGGAGR